MSPTRAAVPRVGAHRGKALCGDDKVVAPAGQPPAEDLLGPANSLEIAEQRIAIRGIDERNPTLSCVIQDRAGLRLVALDAECHRTQTDPRDFQSGAPESDNLHHSSLTWAAAAPGTPGSAYGG